MIVLDTHALIWWIGGDRQLSRKAAALIEKERAVDGVVVSSISAWEIALLTRRGRLHLSVDTRLWLATVRGITGVRFEAVSDGIAVESVELPGSFHDDPTDRIIVATARSLDATLVTKDRRIRDYSHVRTFW